MITFQITLHYQKNTDTLFLWLLNHERKNFNILKMPAEVDANDSIIESKTISRKSNASLHVPDPMSIAAFEKSKESTDEKMKEMRRQAIAQAEKEAFSKLELAKKILSEEEKSRMEAMAREKQEAEKLRDKIMYQQYQKLVEFERSRISKKDFETGSVFLNAQYMKSSDTLNVVQSDQANDLSNAKDLDNANSQELIENEVAYVTSLENNSSTFVHGNDLEVKEVHTSITSTEEEITAFQETTTIMESVELIGINVESKRNDQDESVKETLLKGTSSSN